MTFESRLVELETKFAFQEDLVAQLNQVIIQQQDQLDKLTEQVKQLKNKMTEQFSGQASELNDPAQERPPHY